MRLEFDEQLTLLHREMIAMGALCEQAIAQSSRALLDSDSGPLAEVARLAEQIEHKEREIEAHCLKLLMRQQPVAGDLRTISSVLKMVTDMERIGHQSADMAEIIGLANIAELGACRQPIAGMAAAACKIVTESIDAFVHKDIELAKAVIEYDDVVDAYFDQVKGLLIELFSRPETNGEQTIDLLMIAKYFERIADHAVNIAQWVLFACTGRKGD